MWRIRDGGDGGCDGGCDGNFDMVVVMEVN